MVTRICAPGSLTRTSAALPSSQPSSRNVLMLTAPDRPAGDCVMRTPGSPVSPSGGGLPGAGKTEKTPVSSVIKWPETRSSDMRPKAGSSEGVRAASSSSLAECFGTAMAASDMRNSRSLWWLGTKAVAWD